MTVYGVDVSHFQAGLPDLSDYAFVFQKCTQGMSYVDPTYASRHEAVRNSGRVFGAYHFMSMADSGTAQMTWFAQNAAIKPGDVVILDFEDDGTWHQYTNEQIAQKARDVLGAMGATFHSNRMLLYCNTSVYESIVVPLGVPIMDGLWDAAYRATPPPDPWLFWQYTDVPEDLDQSGAFASLADLMNWSLVTMTSLDTTEQSLVPGSTVTAPLKNFILTADEWSYLLENKDIPALKTMVSNMAASIVSLQGQVTALQASVDALTKFTGTFTISGSGTVG